ncbi:MAG: substrate-binding domain-containing protein [Clostridia bacterium]|nr:substrate-binding domain-containing protein [Clostridia bacterium]
MEKKSNKKKLWGQIALLLAVMLLFVSFDLSIYHIFTKRFISDYDEGLQAKSVALDRYLPFAKESDVVKRKADFTLEGELPKIDGAAALYPVCSAFVHALYPEDSVQFDGEAFTSDSALQMNNTIGCYKGIVDGTIDVALLAGPSEEQLAYAKEQGVELEFVPVGCEAFVFIVNADNPVDSLSTEQVKGIYSGKYRLWSQLGGENKLISALSRRPGSGSQTAFLSFMGDAPFKEERMMFLGSSIGFSFRYYVEGIVEDGDIKMLALDGVYPSKENVSNRSYPIVSEFYAVYRKDNQNENLKILLEYMLSQDGQQIIEESGYVGVNYS